MTNTTTESQTDGPRGRYIVLEGPQGVGKSTQIALLATKLRQAGFPVKVLNEPDGHSDLTSREISKLTRDPLYPMNSRTEVLLYNAARSQSLAVIRDHVNRGVICIVNRNYLTTLAIQYYGRGDIPDYNTINLIIQFAVAGVEPDLCLVLDAPADVLKARTIHRHYGERFDDLDKSFLERVRTGYLWEAKQRNLPVVSAVESEEVVSGTIWRLVTNELAKRSKPKAVAVPLQEQPVKYSEKDNNNQYRYYVPTELDANMTGEFRIHMDKIFDLCSSMSSKLATYLTEHSSVSDSEKAEAYRAIRLVLPVPQTKPIDTPGYAKAIEDLTDNHDPGKSWINSVELSSVWPRNELDLVANILFATSSLSSRVIQNSIADWSYEQKIDVLQSYLGERHSRDDIPGKALEKVHYSWEIVSDYSLFDEFQNQVKTEYLERQRLSPCHGYETPGVIMDTDLSEEYDECFAISHKLYDMLEQAGNTNASQYATLQGHKMRWQVTYNALEAFRILGQPTPAKSHNGFQELTGQMRDKLAEAHPNIAEALNPRYKDTNI